ncbi:MAG TPA: glycosyltransferase family 4 protein [Acidimicrobiales bacterium]|nr:glycosyltransferase family 4 protein [Acidimicrobiales bacterium]
METVQGVLESNGCRSRCRFVGQLSHAEIAAYYQASDVVVSIAETDGTPMSVLEALATEVGVVVGDFAGYDPRYIEPEATVLAASPSDVPALAGTIIRLLEQPDLRDRLGSEGRRRVVRDGTYVTQMKLLHTFYQVLVAKGRRRGRWRWAMVARARQRRAR